MVQIVMIYYGESTKLFLNTMELWFTMDIHGTIPKPLVLHVYFTFLPFVYMVLYQKILYYMYTSLSWENFEKCGHLCYYTTKHGTKTT